MNHIGRCRGVSVFGRRRLDLCLGFPPPKAANRSLRWYIWARTTRPELPINRSFIQSAHAPLTKREGPAPAACASRPGGRGWRRSTTPPGIRGRGCSGPPRERWKPGRGNAPALHAHHHRCVFQRNQKEKKKNEGLTDTARRRTPSHLLPKFMPEKRQKPPSIYY